MSRASTTTLTVTELTFALKNLLETEFSSICVQGEITNFKPNSSGHLYFDLKDAAAKISIVMFRSAAASLSRLPKEGDQVTLKGSIAVYPPHGKYQIIANHLDYLGVGALLLKFEALKKKLQAQGWFEKEKKKPLPKFPKTIGIVTSPTGAVIRDIITVLSRRMHGFHIILNPVPVQGAEAAREIAQAIEDFNTYKLADILIVGRGGGSLEDLWAFNEECVASAIFHSTIPIISAVGHETDFTLADFVADIRAPTPSAAAEIVSQETAAHLQFLLKMRRGSEHALLHLVKQYRMRLFQFSKHPLFSTSYGLLGGQMQRLDEMKKELTREFALFIKEKMQTLKAKQKELIALQPKTQVLHLRQKLLQLEKRLNAAISNDLVMRKEKIKKLKAHLASLDPKNILKRGYAILFARKEPSVIISSQDLAINDELRALLADGEATLTVKDIKHYE